MKKILSILFTACIIFTSCNTDNETLISKTSIDNTTHKKENLAVFNDIRSNMFENLTLSNSIVNNYNHSSYDYNNVKGEIKSNFLNNLKTVTDPNGRIDDIFNSEPRTNYTKNDINNLTSILQIEKDLMINAIDFYENQNIIGFVDFIKRDTNYYLNHSSLDNDSAAKERMIATLANFNGVVDYYDNTLSQTSRGNDCGSQIAEDAAWGAIYGAVGGFIRGCYTGMFFGFNPGSVAAGCMGGMIVGMVQGAVVGAIEGGVRCELEG